jgi:hypothetical protein
MQGKLQDVGVLYQITFKSMGFVVKEWIRLGHVERSARHVLTLTIKQ